MNLATEGCYLLVFLLIIRAWIMCRRKGCTQLDSLLALHTRLLGVRSMPLRPDAPCAIRSRSFACPSRADSDGMARFREGLKANLLTRNRADSDCVWGHLIDPLAWKSRMPAPTVLGPTPSLLTCSFRYKPGKPHVLSSTKTPGHCF